MAWTACADDQHHMAADPKSQPLSNSERLEAATDQAIAACGGNARDAVKALIVANEFLEAQVKELQPRSRLAMRVASLNPRRVIAKIGMTD